MQPFMEGKVFLPIRTKDVPKFAHGARCSWNTSWRPRISWVDVSCYDEGLISESLIPDSTHNDTIFYF